MIDINFGSRSEYGQHIRKFFLYPKFWVDSTKDIKVDPSNWKNIEFDQLNKNKIPSSKGIYAFVVKPKYPSLFQTNYLFYIGKTNRTLKERYKEYLAERDGKGKYRYLVREMLKLYNGHVYFYYLELNDSSQVNEFETSLLNTFVPFVNTDIPLAKIDPDLKNIYKSF